MTLPTESTLMQEATPPIDPTRLHQARNRVRKVIAAELQADMQKRYDELTPADDEPYVLDSVLVYSREQCRRFPAVCKSRGC